MATYISVPRLGSGSRSSGSLPSLPSPEELAAMPPSQRIAAIYAARARRDVARAEQGDYTADTPSTTSSQSAQLAVRLLRSPKEDDRTAAIDWLKDNRNGITEEDLQSSGLQQALDDLDANVDQDKGPAWKMVAGGILNNPIVRTATDLLSRPQQAAMEGIQEAGQAAPIAREVFYGGGGTPKEDRGSIGDVWKALKGEERWDPVNQQYTKNLTLGSAINRERPDDWTKYPYDAFQFVGETALDPLNLIGSTGTSGAKTGLQAGAKELVAEGAETALRQGGGRTRALARAGLGASDEITEEAAQQIIKDVGLRGLTPEARASAERKLAERIAAEGVPRTRLSRLAPWGERTAEQQARLAMQRAARYGRGGIVVGAGDRSLTLLGRSQMRRMAEAAGLADRFRLPTAAERLAPLLDDARTAADRRLTSAEQVLEEAPDLAGQDVLADLTNLSYGLDDRESVLRSQFMVPEEEVLDDYDRLVSALVGAGDEPEAIQDLLRSRGLIKRLADEVGDDELAGRLLSASSDAIKRQGAIKRAGTLRSEASELTKAVDAEDAADILRLSPEAGNALAPSRIREQGGLLKSLGKEDGKALFSRSRKPLETIQDALMPRAGIRRSLSLPEQTAEDLYRIGQGPVGRGSEESARRLRVLAKTIKELPPETSQEELASVTRFLEGEAALGDLPESVQSAASVFKKELDKQTQELVDAGFDPDFLREDYFPHMLTDQGREELRKAISQGRQVLGMDIDGMRRVTTQGGHMMKRDFEGTAAELNAALKSEFGVDADMLVMNPAVAVARRGMFHDKAVASLDILKGAAEGLKASDSGDLVRVLSGAEARDSKKLALAAKAAKERGLVEFPLGPGAGSAWVHPEIAPALGESVNMLSNDDVIRGFDKFMDKLNRTWKAGATMPLWYGPGFMHRNASSNVIMNYMEGVRDPLLYIEAADLQRKARSAVKKFPDLRPSDALRKAGMEDEAALWSSAVDNGALGKDFYSVEVPAHTEKGLERKVKGRILGWMGEVNPLNPESKLMQAGGAYNKAIEDNSRLAHFLGKVRETGDAAAAGRSVSKTLLDYHDITDFHRNRISKFIPFFTFLRGNVANQVRYLAENPGRVARAQRAAEYAVGLVGGRDPEQGGDTWGGRAGALAAGQFVPGWTQQGELGQMIGPGGLGTSGGPAFASADTPLTSALGTLDPAYKLAQILTGSGDTDSGDLARALLAVPGGPVPSAARLAAEEGTGKSMFSGGSIRERQENGDFGDRKTPLWQSLSSILYPQIGRTAQVYGGDESAGVKVAEGVTGLGVREITKQDSDKGLRYAVNAGLRDRVEARDAEVQALRARYEAAVLAGDEEEAQRVQALLLLMALPSVEDLRRSGLVPGGRSGGGTGRSALPFSVGQVYGG
mgnify:FL=1